MTKEETEDTIHTIERLGLELVEHNHVWSPSLKNQYNKTLARLKKKLDGLPKKV